MPALIFWKSVIKALVLPPTGLLLVIFAGLWMARKGRRLGLALAGGGALALLALAVPLVAVALVETLDPPAPFDGRTADAGAIVIVGGGARRMAPEYAADTVNALSLERVRYGARVARTTGLPVLVTGGAPQGFSTEASLMQRALEEDFGVRVQWIESESLDTRENARLSARILRSHGIHKVVLVTHAFDMKRAAAEFRDEGIEIVPAAVGIPNSEQIGILDFLPAMNGLQLSYYALYEIVANVKRSIVPVVSETESRHAGRSASWHAR